MVKDMFTFRITGEMKQEIENISKREGITTSDTVRLLIWLGIAVLRGKSVDIEDIKQYIKMM